MHILHITPVFPSHTSGMANAVFVQAREMADRGDVVTVFVPRRKDSAGGVQRYGNIEVRRLAPIMSWGNAASIPGLLLHLRGFDIVRLHYPFFGGAEWVLLARKLGLINKLELFYHMDAVLYGLLGVIGNLHERMVLGPLVRTADSIFVSSMDYFEHSRLARRYFSNSGSTLKHKVAEAPLAIDARRFNMNGDGSERIRLKKKLGILEAAQVVLFVGGLDRAHYFKGVDILLRAFQMYLESVKNKFYPTETDVQPQPVLVLVGDGELKEKYRQLSRELGIESQVRFAGMVSDDDLPWYYRMASVTVLPSINGAEAFGLVLLESLASGTPVIASDLPGVRTVVARDPRSKLVKAGDVAALSEMIRDIASNGTVR